MSQKTMRAILYAEAVCVVCPECGAEVPNTQGSHMWLRDEVTSHMDIIMQCTACDIALRMPTNTRKVTFE